MTFEETALDVQAVTTLAHQLGIEPDQLRLRLQNRPAAPPTVRAHIEQYLASQTQNTRRTYQTHLRRLSDGVGPVCDQTCEACLNPDNSFTCHCTCSSCMASRLSITALGDEPVGPTSYSAEHARVLAVIARRLAIKKGFVDNRVRANRGKPPKMADGYGAEETAIGAARSLYNSALHYCDGTNAALQIPKPRRSGNERRPMQPFELVELVHATAIGGNDPSLDSLIVDYCIQTGSRREGVYKLTVGQLHLERQIIDLRDKYKRRQPAPVSRELVERLMTHAVTRGGDRCNPSTPHYQPDSLVFHVARSGRFVPITSRRIDSLIERWHQQLPWANEEQLGLHHLRHTIAALLASCYGPQYKKRYLRHTDGNVTDGYGVCTFEELARAMSDLLAFQHPQVHGLEERRRRTLNRLGLPSEGLR